MHTANGVKRFLGNVLEKARRIAQHIDFRIDAGYTIGSVLDHMTRENLRFVTQAPKSCRVQNTVPIPLKRSTKGMRLFRMHTPGRISTARRVWC